MRMRCRTARIETRFFIDRREKLRRDFGTFGIAEKQKSFPGKREMKNFHQSPPRAARQVNQKITARNQIEPRERRVAQNIVRREQNHFAKLRLDTVIFAFFDEKSF